MQSFLSGSRVCVVNRCFIRVFTIHSQKNIGKAGRLLMFATEWFLNKRTNYESKNSICVMPVNRFVVY